MLDRPQRQGPALAWKAADGVMAGNGSDTNQDKARRFRDAALPHLDDVYTLARYLLRDTTEIKPWLFAILRNVCRGEYARRSGVVLYIDRSFDGETDEDKDAVRAAQRLRGLDQ